jgi:hypothetical protein
VVARQDFDEQFSFPSANCNPAWVSVVRYGCTLVDRSNLRVIGPRWHRVIGDTEAELDRHTEELIASGQADPDDGFIRHLIVSPETYP